MLALNLLTLALTLANVTLFVFGKLGGYEIVNWISRTQGKNMSIINLGNPDMFTDDSTLAVFHEATKVLATTLGTPGKTKLQGTRIMKFNLDVAKSLLLLSALVYERKEGLVTDAVKITKWTKERLLDSEKVIHKIAASYNLKFASISDFTRWVERGTTACISSSLPVLTDC